MPVGNIQMNSTPSGALITLAGMTPGYVTPHFYEAYFVGTYDYLLEKEGWDDYSGSVTVDTNETTQVDAELVPMAWITGVTAIPNNSTTIFVQWSWSADAVITHAVDIYVDDELKLTSSVGAGSAGEVITTNPYVDHEVCVIQQ